MQINSNEERRRLFAADLINNRYKLDAKDDLHEEKSDNDHNSESKSEDD